MNARGPQFPPHMRGVHGDLLTLPSQSSCGIEYVALDIRLKSELRVTANLLKPWILWPSPHWYLIVICKLHDAYSKRSKRRLVGIRMDRDFRRLSVEILKEGAYLVLGLMDVNKSSCLHSPFLYTVRYESKGTSDSLAEVREKLAPLTQGMSLGECAIIRLEIGGTLEALYPATRLQRSIRFGEQGIPIWDTSHEQSQVDIVKGISRVRPAKRAVFDFADPISISGTGGTTSA